VLFGSSSGTGLFPTGKSADTITTVTPSPTQPPAGHILAQGRRGTHEEGEAHQGGHRLHNFTPHQTGTPEKGRDDGRTRWDGEESELLHMIEKIYLYKEDKCTHFA
jgi:hypothetical protein